MPRPGMTIIYAAVTPADHARLRHFLRGQTMSDWMRALINQDLEDAGEAPLSTDQRRHLKADRAIHAETS